jgi:threonine/homoserine/homoserine lactone efflux protein
VTDLWPYLAVTAAVVITPGPDTMVVVRQALRGGRRHAAGTAAGVCSGLVVWAAAAAFGLAAALAASHDLFTVIKLVGAAYLIFLGLHALWAVRRPTTPAARPVSGSGWRSGALTCLGNPKVGVFYTSFLPQFLPAHGSALQASLLLAAIHIALSFACLLGYGMLATHLGDLFEPARRRRLEAFSGGVLCALGLGLVVQTAREST